MIHRKQGQSHLSARSPRRHSALRLLPASSELESQPDAGRSCPFHEEPDAWWYEGEACGGEHNQEIKDENTLARVAALLWQDGK